MKTLKDAIGATAVRQIQRRIRSGKIKPSSNRKNFKGQKKTTLFDSGRLYRSITYKISGDKIIVGTNVKYAKIQQEGGVIKPKNKKWLTIPLTPAAKAKRAPDFSDTFAQFYTEDGKAYGIIFQKAEPEPIALYKLVKRVNIPARPFLFLDDTDKEKIAGAALDWLKLNIKKYADARR